MNIKLTSEIMKQIGKTLFKWNNRIFNIKTEKQ